jgi:hypothetical protein
MVVCCKLPGGASISHNTPNECFVDGQFHFTTLQHTIVDSVLVILGPQPSNWLPYIVAAPTTKHRKHMSRFSMRVNSSVAQHWVLRGPHRKHIVPYNHPARTTAENTTSPLLFAVTAYARTCLARPA